MSRNGTSRSAFSSPVFASQIARVSTESCSRRIDRIVRAGNGLSLNVDVGEGCEPFHVLLGRIEKGRIWLGVRFTKTQYALHFVNAHLLGVRMIDVCREAGILRRVKDGGSADTHVGASLDN